jgi:hypothetical protein
MKDFSSWLESELSKADKALSLVPKDEYLKLREAFARKKELTIAKEIYIKFTQTK